MLASLCFITIVLNSCTMPFWAYIRNMSMYPAVIDVVLLDKGSMRTLPNQVKVADTIVAFKSGFRQHFYKRESVQWIDTSHFSFTIKPGSSIDLSDLAGRFVNSFPVENVFVTVTANHVIDTLIERRHQFRHEKFGYKNVGVSVPVLYYDVK